MPQVSAYPLYPMSPMVHFPPIEPQGQYRYDPSTLEPQGPARLFPYTGDDGTLRYIATKLRQNLLDQGKLSPPWSLLLQRLEAAQKATDESWIRVTTLLADLEIFQSDWFNFDLPPNEQFNTDYVRSRREMTLTLLSARHAGQAATQPDQARSRFYSALEARGRSLPVVSRIHQRDGGLSDREFARQRLAGQNPMVLRRVQSSDSLPAWAQSCTLADGRALDLVQTAENDRLFVADYPLLQFAPSDLQAGRYVGSPVALFQRSSNGLEPVLIQIESGRVIAPNDPADDWMRAKLCVQTADVTHHELLAHLCYTHLAMEAFAIATPRQLPVTHPVYTLLRPHFRFLLAINTRGNTILLGEDAAIDKLMAPTRDACLDLINRAYRSRPFSDYALPTDIQQRGLEPEFLPDFPYRDDARLLWDAIARYVTRYLHRYYPDDRAVLLDPYLQAWAAELGVSLETRPRTDFPQAPAWTPKEWIVQTGLDPTLPDYSRIPGLLPDGKLASLQQLIDLATTVIFTCGPQHAAVNFSQFDYVGYTPNAPLALYSRPDTPASLVQLLPPIEQDLGQMELAFALSGIRWGQIGSSDLIRFADAGDRETLAQFQTDLQTIEQTIQQRDQQRLTNTGVAYPYLLPSRIPNSINI